MEQAKFENLVVCLPTGSGKTYIAVMLIKEMSHAVRTTVNDGGKRTVFLVKTGSITYSSIDYIKRLLSFKSPLFNSKVITFVFILI